MSSPCTKTAAATWPEPRATSGSAAPPCGATSRATESKLEIALGLGEREPRHREVGPAPVQRQVEEESRLGPERADQVVLLAQRDQDVLDLVLEPQALHGLSLGAHH